MSLGLCLGGGGGVGVGASEGVTEGHFSYFLYGVYVYVRSSRLYSSVVV